MTDKLYPSIPEATEEDYKFSLSGNYLDDCACAGCKLIRIAAHHARRAAELERRLAEAKSLLKLFRREREFGNFDTDLCIAVNDFLGDAVELLPAKDAT